MGNSSASSRAASRSFESKPGAAPPTAVACGRDTGDTLPSSDGGGISNSVPSVCTLRGSGSQSDVLVWTHEDAFETVVNWPRESFTRGELGFDEAPALDDLLDEAHRAAIWRFKRSLNTEEADLVARSIHTGPGVVFTWEVDKRKIDSIAR